MKEAPPVWDAFLIQDFVISYALFTETVILILNEYEHVIKNIRIWNKKEQLHEKETNYRRINNPY